jgi:hypothetical protein
MATKPHRLFPHDELRQLAPNLWIVRGGMPFPLYRNMVVYRLPDRRLMLHSLVALGEAGMKQLEGIGDPSILVIPHGYDGMDAHWYFERYPQAAFLAPDEEHSHLEDFAAKITDDPARVLPSLGFRLHKAVGLKLTEYVLEAPVDGGVALMCTSVLANRGAAPSTFMGRLVATTMMSGDQLATGRMMRLFMVKNKPAFKRFLAMLATIPNVKIVTVAHGDPITDGDITAKLKQAAV